MSEATAPAALAAPGTAEGPCDVSVILVSYNTASLLDPCLDRLALATRGIPSEVVVVDNDSRDASLDILKRRSEPIRLVVNARNVGFGRANNQALGLSRGRYVLLLNTDAFVEPDSVRSAIEHMELHPRCGVLGVRLVDGESRLQPSYRHFPTPWSWFVDRSGLRGKLPAGVPPDNDRGDVAVATPCDWVPGCFYLVRRAVIDRVGLFDPRFFVYCEEVDHCRAVKAAGYEVHYFPGTTVTHLGGESAKSDAAITAAGRQNSRLQVESEFLYFRKHHGLAGAVCILAGGLVAELLWALRGLVRRQSLALARVSASNVGLAVRQFLATDGGRRPTR